MKIYLNNIIIFNYSLTNRDTLLYNLFLTLKDKCTFITKNCLSSEYIFLNKGIILDYEKSFKDYNLTNEDYIVIIKPTKIKPELKYDDF